MERVVTRGLVWGLPLALAVGACGGAEPCQHPRVSYESTCASPEAVDYLFCMRALTYAAPDEHEAIQTACTNAFLRGVQRLPRESDTSAQSGSTPQEGVPKR